MPSMPWSAGEAHPPLLLCTSVGATEGALRGDLAPIPLTQIGRSVLRWLRRLPSRIAASPYTPPVTAAALAAEATARQAMALLDDLPGLLVVTDARGHIRHLNRSAQEAFGYTPTEIAGQPIELLLPDQSTSRAPRAARKDGTTFVAEVALASTFAEGEIVLAHLVRDVSHDQTRLRQEEEFFAGVAHELRLPLTTIRASVEVLADTLHPDLPEELQRLLLNVEHETQRLGTMVDDLLDLNSIQAGRNHFRPRPHDLRDVVGGAVRAIMPLLEQRGQRLHLDLPCAPAWSVVDAELLERALLNLLGNAHKYGRDGGKLQVRLEADHQAATFSVIDDGPGIPAGDHERIFQRLYRSPTTDGRRVQGNGLGLPMCRAAVELHGGRVWAEEVPEGGSVFWITLPTGDLLADG